MTIYREILPGSGHARAIQQVEEMLDAVADASANPPPLIATGSACST
jgi:hypothetical protein